MSETHCWRFARLSEIANVHGGGTPSRENHSSWDGDIPWLTPSEITGTHRKVTTATHDRITDSGLRSSGAFLLPAGALLVTTRATLGARTLAGVPMSTNQGFKNLVFDRSIANPDFYYHLLETMIPEMEKRASGTTFREISGSQFGAIQVPVPPLKEQCRIAEVFDVIDARIRSFLVVISKLSVLRSGMIEQHLTAYGETNAQVRLVDVMMLPSRQVDPRVEPHRSRTLLAPDHVESQTGRILARVSATDQGAISGKYPVAPGDVVLSKIRPYLRKVALADFEGTCSADMYPLRAKGQIDPSYLHIALLAERFSRFAETVSARTGIPKINRLELAEYSTCFPPLAEQRRMLASLSAVDEGIDAQLRSHTKLRELKLALTEDLLTARVRAPVGAGV